MVSISIRIRFSECHISCPCKVPDKKAAFAFNFSDVKLIRGPGMEQIKSFLPVLKDCRIRIDRIDNR
jgi:hypothetical protein